MPEVTTREELKYFALRKLGHPIIEINISDDQIEDRIDEALQYFQEWHFDGSEKLYMKHQIQASIMPLDSAIPLDSFKQGEVIVGQTSQATATVWKQPDTMTIQFYLLQGTFIPGETISSENATAVISFIPNCIVLGEMDKKYVDIPHHVLSVSKIFPIQINSGAYYLFDGQYYMLFDILYNFKSADLLTYDMTKTYINLIQQLLIGQKPIRFNRHMEKLYIDFDWKRAVKPEDYIIIECYRVLDPETYTNIYDNYFLKQYTTALMKIQWGENLSKFANIQLLGGITLDGPRILEDGKTEKEKLEEDMKLKYSYPYGFLMG